MNYKIIVKTLLIGLIVFAVAVVLGMKYNWVRYLLPGSPTSVEVEQGSLPSSTGEADSSTAVPKAPPKDKVKHFEIVDEKKVTGSTEELIRNDCIRASRRAGVTDEHIFEVVNQCVEMYKKEQGGALATPALSIESDEDNNDIELPSVEDSLELTRKACKIVADEEKGLSSVERQKVIEQCVKANMNTP